MPVWFHFLSREAIYIVAFDLEQDLMDQISRQEWDSSHKEWVEVKDEYTNLDVLIGWINTIHHKTRCSKNYKNSAIIARGLLDKCERGNKIYPFGTSGEQSEKQVQKWCNFIRAHFRILNVLARKFFLLIKFFEISQKKNFALCHSKSSGTVAPPVALVLMRALNFIAPQELFQQLY